MFFKKYIDKKIRERLTIMQSEIYHVKEIFSLNHIKQNFPPHYKCGDIIKHNNCHLTILESRIQVDYPFLVNTVMRGTAIKGNIINLYKYRVFNKTKNIEYWISDFELNNTDRVIY